MLDRNNELTAWDRDHFFHPSTHIGMHARGETPTRVIAGGEGVYVRACRNPDGGYSYMARQGGGGGSGFARSAAGVSALYYAGKFEGDEIATGLNYLKQFTPGKGMAADTEGHYFYGHYYAVQAMWHAGSTHWNKWYPAIREALIARQSDDGSWMDSICLEYGTAMACIILQMPNNFLPIFQR